MKILMTLAFCCCLALNSPAQIKALTGAGEEVLLYKDGTWKYVNDSLTKEIQIPLNTKEYVRSGSSSFLLKSKNLNVGFWLDSKTWLFNKAENNPDAEYEVHLKSGDIYGMIITEKIEIPLETLRNIALENGQKVSPDLQITKEEYRMVNGIKVLMIQMNGTVQGMKLAYFGYYYSNAEGTVQFITYTSTSLMKSMSSSCEELLNGLVEIKK